MKDIQIVFAVEDEPPHGAAISTPESAASPTDPHPLHDRAVVTNRDYSPVSHDDWFVLYCTGRHVGHDVWDLISKPGTSWCRTCKVHFKRENAA